MLHGFKPANHCFNTGSYLLVLLQQIGALGGEYVLSLFQRFVFVLQLIANAHERIDALRRHHDERMSAGDEPDGSLTEAVMHLEVDRQTDQELLEGMRVYASELFGPLAAQVWLAAELQ